MACCLPPTELHGYGAILQFFDCPAGEWVTIGGTADLEVPAITREKSETNGDDGDGTMHYIPNPQYDLGDTSFELDFRAGQHRRMSNIARNTSIQNWRVVLNNQQQTFFQWCAFVSELGVAVPKGEIVKANLTLSATGGGMTEGELNE